MNLKIILLKSLSVLPVTCVYGASVSSLDPQIDFLGDMAGRSLSTPVIGTPVETNPHGRPATAPASSTPQLEGLLPSRQVLQKIQIEDAKTGNHPIRRHPFGNPETEIR